MPTVKKVIIHPKNEAGQIDENTHIYPKTTIDQVYTSDGATPYDDSAFQKTLTPGTGISIDENALIKVNLDNATGGDNSLKTTLLNLLYPINSIYTCVELPSGVSTCPIQATLGGTWVRIRDKFLLTAGDTYANGSTGGNASVSLSISNMPSHHHSAGNLTTSAQNITGGAHEHSLTLGKDNAGTSGGADVNYVNYTSEGFETLKITGGSHSHEIPATQITGDTGDNGSGTAFSIMPPYLVVYAWKRTA